MDKITQADLDLLMDISWWIRGYMAADASGCPFGHEHRNALDKAHTKLALVKEEQDRPPCRPEAERTI